MIRGALASSSSVKFRARRFHGGIADSQDARDALTPEQRKRRDAAWIRGIVRRQSRNDAQSLVGAYYDGVFSYIFRQVHDREQTLNLTQETMIAALQSLASYDAERGAFSTWLYHIATYKVIDLLRSRHRRESMIADMPAGLDTITDRDAVGERGPDIAALLEDRDLLERIARRVEQCDPVVQQIYRLHLYAGQSFSEIAHVTGGLESTMKTKYYRLIAALRKEFSHERR